MGKRRISSPAESSDDNYCASPPPSKVITTIRNPVKKKPRIIASDDDFRDEAEEATQPRPHTVSIHLINAPGPLRVALLEWYAGVHETRGMPWRKQYDPLLGRDGRAQRAYEVWISEIMLQQTQVATVIPYYNRWMERFPTIRDLATSDTETVNSLWKGLGYYSRAARLLSGAKKVVDEFGGRLPDNAKDMEEKIPGIGRYSAGAICSIAYNQCVPVLDGNVNRLLSRVLALYASPKAKSTLDMLWSGATSMVEEADHPGDINQALIELGSTVCKVREPLCEQCPLQPWCKAYELVKGSDAASKDVPVSDIEDMCSLCELLPVPTLVTTFPMKVQRKKAREELDIVNVIEWRSGGNRWFLLVRRPEGGLLAGLHEFPTRANVSGTSASASAQTKICHALLSELLQFPVTHASSVTSDSTPASQSLGDSVLISKIKQAGDVIHVFSHIRKTYRVQWVVLEGGGSGPPQLATSSTRPTKNLTRSKRKGKVNWRKKDVLNAAESSDQEADEPISVTAKWIPLDKVSDANIGTGVMKVWNLVRMLWEMKS